MGLITLLRRILAPAPVDNDQVIAMLTLAHREHIVDLEREVESLKEIIRVLSDDKYFAPRIAKGEPQTSEPYRPMFPADSLSDVESFNAAKDAETAKAQDQLAADLEKEFYEIAAEQAVSHT